LFEEMNEAIKEDVLKAIFTVKFNKADASVKTTKINANYEKENVSAYGNNEPVKQEPVKVAKKVGKNEPCTCGSGKKYKFCCGKNAEE